MALEGALHFGLTSVAGTEYGKRMSNECAILCDTHGQGLLGPLMVQRTGDLEFGSR